MAQREREREIYDWLILTYDACVLLYLSVWWVCTLRFDYQGIRLATYAKLYTNACVYTVTDDMRELLARDTTCFLWKVVHEGLLCVHSQREYWERVCCCYLTMFGSGTLVDSLSLCGRYARDEFGQVQKDTKGLRELHKWNIENWGLSEMLEMNLAKSKKTWKVYGNCTSERA